MIRTSTVRLVAALATWSVGGTGGVAACAPHADPVAGEGLAVASHARARILEVGSRRAAPAAYVPAPVCGCVGPCHGGVSPKLGEASELATTLRSPGRTLAVAPLSPQVGRDPNAHLLPRPNPPPQRV